MQTNVHKEDEVVSLSKGRTEFYSEVSRDDRFKDLVHFSKLTSSFPISLNHLDPYFGVALSGDALSSSQAIYNDNFVAPLLGVRVPLQNFPVSAFAEIRAVFPQFADDESKQAKSEFRSGLVGGEDFSILHLNSGLRIFSDSYGEAIFSSRLENNVFVNLSEKIGLEKKWNSSWGSQIYGEGYGRRDRLGYYYENLQEARLGARHRFAMRQVSISVSAHLGFGSYAGREYRDPNPNSSSYTQTAALFVFGAQL